MGLLRTARGIGAMLAVATGAQAQTDEPLQIEDASKWGSVYRVVTPEFPPAAVAGKVTGYVDVTGIVSGLHRILDATYRAETDAAKVFIPALQEVFKHWLFRPPLGKDCQPSTQPVTTRVWFEEGGKISVSRLRGLPAPTANPRPPLTKVDPTFPREAIRANESGANVYARVRVAREGHVQGVDATPYPRNSFSRAFERATSAAIERWTFAESPTGDWIGCIEVEFRLR